MTDALWRILQRYDFYVATTNARAPVLTAFNTFVVSGVILAWQEVLADFAEPAWAAAVAGSLLALIALASLLSLWFVFRSISPYTRARAAAPDAPIAPAAPIAPIAPDAGSPAERSVIFFEDVHAFPSAAAYREAVAAYTPERLERDLATQVHALSRAVSEKFVELRRAALAILHVQIPALTALVALRLYLTLR
jgi:hypothetical protein